MMNTYTEILEQIVIEMKPSDTDYHEWLDFLRRVYTESKLFKNDHHEEAPSMNNSRADPDKKVDSDSGPEEYSDLREIIRLAAVHNHPTWYIQPHFIGPKS